VHFQHGIKSTIQSAIDRSLLDNMPVPTFVDLQVFIVNKKFIVKEIAVLKQGTVLTYYIFRAMKIFDKIPQVLRFLVERLSMDCDGRTGWSRTMSRNIWSQRCIWRWCYRMLGDEKMWLWNLLLNDEWERMYIETLDAVFKDMESLTNLDVANTMRCRQQNTRYKMYWKYITGGCKRIF